MHFYDNLFLFNGTWYVIIMDIGNLTLQKCKNNTTYLSVQCR